MSSGFTPEFARAVTAPWTFSSLQPHATQCLTPGFAVMVAATLSCAPVGVLSVATSMVCTPATAWSKASLAAFTRSPQTVTSCFQAEMIRVSPAFQPAFLNSSAARSPTCRPICWPEKPIRGTRSEAAHWAGAGPLAHTWSSEVSSAALASRAVWTTCGPTAGSGTTMISPLLFCATAACTSLTVLFASLPRFTTFRSAPSSAALAFAPAASSTKYCWSPCFCR